MLTKHDHQQHPADVGAELRVDEEPGLVDDTPLRARDHREHDRLRALAVEDPVRRDREDEEDAYEDLDRLPAELECGRRPRWSASACPRGGAERP